MNRLVFAIWRLILAVLGFIAACLALSAFVHLLVLGGLTLDTQEAELAKVSSLLTIPALAAFAGYHIFIPAWAMAMISEVFAFRDWLVHAFGGAAAAMAGLYSSGLMADAQADTGFLATAIAAGIVFGLGYWAVAGRRAGLRLPGVPDSGTGHGHPPQA